MSISLSLYREFLKKCKNLFLLHEQNVTKLKQKVYELLDNEKYYNVFLCPDISIYEHYIRNSCYFIYNLSVNQEIITYILVSRKIFITIDILIVSLSVLDTIDKINAFFSWYSHEEITHMINSNCKKLSFLLLSRPHEKYFNYMMSYLAVHNIMANNAVPNIKNSEIYIKNMLIIDRHNEIIMFNKSMRALWIRSCITL